MSMKLVFEALERWNDPRLKVVRPLNFDESYRLIVNGIHVTELTRSGEVYFLKGKKEDGRQVLLICDYFQPVLEAVPEATPNAEKREMGFHVKPPASDAAKPCPSPNAGPG